MKKILCVILTAILILSCFAGCDGAVAETPDIIVTIFPLYDFTRVILGDNPADLEIGLLEKNGIDLHNFQPSAEDVACIGMSKLFVYVGGESDEWAEAALETVQSGTVCCLMDAVTALAEETVEGMQAEDHDHGEDHGEDEDHGEAEVDEHIWLSLRNAQKMVEALCEDICTVDPANEGTYRANAEAYIAKLQSLDADYQQAVAAAAFDTILVADRFPFRYLAADYNLTYYAAFSGCAASLDVSFETVAFLSEKLAALQLPAVLIIDGSDGSVAQTVAENSGTNAKILTLHSCQCVTNAELESGLSYLDIMTSNLAILKEALG